jgi:hypothetical protein
MEPKADKCRRIAEECQQQAAQAGNSLDRQRWLKLAAQWQKLNKQHTKTIKKNSRRWARKTS